MSSVHVVCPYCQTVNRLQSTRLNENPKCGDCKHGLFASRPSKLTSRNFELFIQHNDIPVLVDFWAPWCSPCKTMAPAFEQAAARLEPWFRLAKVDIENEQSLAKQYQISSVPTLVLFKSNREVARQSGAMTTSEIMNWAVKPH